MGDRANIGFKQDDEGCAIWLYMHWGGSGLPELAVRAVDAARPRWGDESYATRIALTELVGKVTGPLGYGVSTQIGDNEHDLIVIDWDARQYLVLRYGDTEEWYRMSQQERASAFAAAVRLPFEETGVAELSDVWDRP